MVYYRVKEQFDQAYKNSKVHDDNVYIGKELYTEKEVEREKLNKNYMEKIEVSKRKVYWNFGARFLIEK